MCRCRVLFVRAAVSDMRANDNQRRPLPLLLRFVKSAVYRLEIIAVGQILHEPAVSLEAPPHIFVEGQVRRALNADVIVIVKEGEVAETEKPGDRSSLRRDALHQVAVTADAVNVVVYDFVPWTIEMSRQIFFGNSHADRIAKTLAQRTGGRFDSRREPTFWMSRSPAAPLPELLDVVKREIVTGKVQQTVKQHAAVTSGKDKAVAVGPVRLLRMILQKARPQEVCHGSRSHGQTRMPRVRLLHSIHGQAADRIDAELVELGLIEHLSSIGCLSLGCTIAGHEVAPSLECGAL